MPYQDVVVNIKILDMTHNMLYLLAPLAWTGSFPGRREDSASGGISTLGDLESILLWEGIGRWPVAGAYQLSAWAPSVGQVPGVM